MVPAIFATSLPLIVTAPLGVSSEPVAPSSKSAASITKSASRPTLQALLRAWSEALLTLRERHRAVVRWALDVDPLSL